MASFTSKLMRGAAKAPVILAACGMLVSACATPVAGPDGNYARPIGNAPVTSNPTPYSGALICLGQYARQNGIRPPRVAVGRIADYTGKEEADGSGRKLTQGASLMAISALAKAGAPMVERYDTSVSELELKYANNRLISDGDGDGAAADLPADYRRIVAGQVPGSDFYIVGGITELNYNIRSSGAQANVGEVKATGVKGALGARLFVMNIGLDLRLVNTRSLEVVDVVSYQKQIVGHEVSLGFFDIMGGNVFDVSAGAGGLEPLQLGVRAVVERAVIEMMANLYGMPGPEGCINTDPLGDPTLGVTGGFTPAYNNVATNNAQTREDPNRWHDRRDPAVPVVRGRY